MGQCCTNCARSETRQTKSGNDRPWCQLIREFTGLDTGRECEAHLAPDAEGGGVERVVAERSRQRRDMFAAAALTGLLAAHNATGGQSVQLNGTLITKNAWALADMMPQAGEGT